MPLRMKTTLIASGCLALGLAVGCASKNQRMSAADKKMQDGRMMRDEGMRSGDEQMRMKGERMVQDGQQMKGKGMSMPESGGMAMPETMSMEQRLEGWPESSKKAATTTTEKYGPPDGMTNNMLVWNDKAPWKQIIISREEVPHAFPMKHPDVLEQVIEYRVPPDKFDDLAMYDGSVVVERTKGTMSARCDKEGANFLALNLAHDIITDKKTVEEARDFYAKTIMASMKGEKPPYMQKLQFQPSRGNTMDPDKGAMER